MISHIDHLTLSTPHFEVHRTLFKRLGYTERFVQHNVGNTKIKRSYTHVFTPKHHLALFDAPHSLSIELVYQGDRAAVESAITPILDHLPASLSTISGRKIKLIDGTEVVETIVDSLDVPVFVSTTGAKDPCRVQACVIRTPDVSASVALWEAVGGVATKQDSTRALVTFQSPFASFRARFYFIKEPVKSKLDSYGFNYVALVSTSAQREREHLLANGFTTTPLGTETVNGKNLELFFVGEGTKATIEIFGIK